MLVGLLGMLAMQCRWPNTEPLPMRITIAPACSTDWKATSPLMAPLHDMITLPTPPCLHCTSVCSCGAAGGHRLDGGD